MLKCPKASLMLNFKNEIKRENYLSLINDRELRVVLSKLRLSDHELAIEKGRYSKLKRQDRLYSLCRDSQEVKMRCIFYSIFHSSMTSKTPTC